MRLPIAIVGGCAVLAAGCGSGTHLYTIGPGRLSHGGISIDVPPRWSGRVLYKDPRGNGAIFEVASFKMPRQVALEPPKPLGHGEKDFKSMTGSDVLVAVETRTEVRLAHPLPLRIGYHSFLPHTAVGVPVGHTLAREVGCSAERCVLITVDFASRPVRPALLAAANDVVGSLRIARAN